MSNRSNSVVRMSLKTNRKSVNLGRQEQDNNEKIEQKRANNLGGEQFGGGPGEDLSCLMGSPNASPRYKEKTSKIKINKKKFDKFKQMKAGTQKKIENLH